jgi:hypothetical protein
MGSLTERGLSGQVAGAEVIRDGHSHADIHDEECAERLSESRRFSSSSRARDWRVDLQPHEQCDEGFIDASRK